MALEWQTLGGAPDSSSPGGGAEIRHVVRSPLGDLTHAVCRAGEVAPTHDLPELDEAYFVLAGEGQIWRSLHGREAITRMRPGRAVWMPAGTQFQYRANQTTSLVFLVVVMPPWKSELFHTNDAGPWTVGADGPAEPTDDSWLTVDVRRGPDETAPDGSEIRLLGGVERGASHTVYFTPGPSRRPSVIAPCRSFGTSSVGTANCGGRAPTAPIRSICSGPAPLSTSRSASPSSSARPVWMTWS